MKLHFATCASWITSRTADCTCIGAQQRPWRIRKTPHELFPWTVYRRTGSAAVNGIVYERLMSCSTYQGAVELVASMIWLSKNGLRSESV